MKRWLRKLRLARYREFHKSWAGYTITEVMIVLAVSSALFVAVVLSFGGKQAKVEFTQAVRNYEANLQNIISDVSEGYYRSGFTCTAPASGPPTLTATATEAGSNSGCVFLGKLISSGNNSNSILTIVGRRTITGTANDVTTLAESSPVAVHNITGVSVTEDRNYGFGLQVRKVLRLSDSTSVTSFGFFHQLSGGTSGIKGGSRAVLLYGIPGTTTATSANSTASQVSSLVNIPEGILICLLGANGQRAEITVGAYSSQTRLNSVLDTRNTGVCNE